MKLLRFLYVASEMTPFTADSALAKESHFLSRSLAELGADVTVTLPGYAVAEHARLGLARRLSPLKLTDSLSGADPGASLSQVTIHEGSASGGRVSVVVIDLPGQESGDADGKHQALFCRAALEVARIRGSWPDVVFAGHRTEPVLAMARTLGAEELPAPATIYLLRDAHDTPEVRDALAHADRVVLPSRSWADDICRRIDENPKSRDRVVKLLAPVRGAIRGVPSGIDPITWNPRQDRYLTPDFSRDLLAGKAHFKEELKRSLGLRSRSEPTPLIAVLGPLDPNIITYGVANALTTCNAFFVVLADAERDATSLRHLQRLLHQAPNRVVLRSSGPGEEHRALEHRLLAGSDLALLAHGFSPTTLCELSCMHYGAVPIAPSTGSFADLIVEFDNLTATGNGFLYSPADGEHIMGAVHRALRAYENQASFSTLVNRVMTTDLSWRTAAQRYLNIIVDLLREMHRLAA